MPLQLTGKSLGLKTETIGEGSSAFQKTTCRVIAGSGFETETIDVGFGRDFPADQMPKEGEDVTLNVVVSVFSGRNGAGYRLTALSRVGGRRLAATGS